MNITKEQAEEMQRCVNEAKARRLVSAAVDMFSDEPAKRTKTPHSERNPKTATTVGAKPERETGATMAKPQRKKNPEYNLQKEYVQEMGRRYPHVLIFSDAAAHVAKSMIQQVRANALQSKGQKWPDVFVAQPSGDYAGLFLEFKAETPYKVDGVTLKKSDHVEAQARTMQELSCRGYLCSFVWSVEIALDVTERYLNGQL